MRQSVRTGVAGPRRFGSVTRLSIACGLVLVLTTGERPSARAGLDSTDDRDATTAVVGAFDQAVAYKAHGFGFSPYIDGQNPNFSPQISVGQIRARMQIIAPYTTWVRSFGSTNGLENIPSVAREFGLQMAAGAWIGPNLAANETEIANLIAAAQAGQVDIAIVGSEALLRQDVSEAQLIDYIERVRQAIPLGIPVTTADTYDTLLAHPNVIAASDVVMPNIYPYWQGVSFDNASCAVGAAYQQTVGAAGGKPVIISETGWPSGGNAVGAAVPSPENASQYFLRFVSWARSNNVPFFYFEALDESWKANYEGPQGAHWGVWDKDGALKAGMQAVFDGDTDLVDCNGIPGGPGTPRLQFTYVPPYGSFDSLEGQALHVAPAAYKAVTYINVAGTWWVKPTFAQPLTPIQQDGSWSTDITTGGVDETAMKIATFLIPNGYNPPLTPSSTLPDELYQNSVANVQVSRSQNALSGQILSASGYPLTQITIELFGADTGTTQSAPDGKYSFPNLAGSGPATLVPSYPNYVFAPPSQTVPVVNGNQVVNFTGAPTADLTIQQYLSPNPLVVGTSVTNAVVVANAGPATASNAIVTLTIPSSFALVSVSSTKGSCTSTTPIKCDVGGLVLSASATITVVATPAVTGSFTIVSNVVGPDPDPNTSNNSVTGTLTVGGAIPVVTITAIDAAEVGPAGTPIQGLFRIQRDVTDQSLSVGLAALGGSATNGVDYAAIGLGSVTFPVGVAVADVPVNPIADAAIEGNETATLSLASSPNYTLGPQPFATAAIADYAGGTLGPLQGVSFGRTSSGSFITKTLSVTNTSASQRLVVTIGTPTAPFSIASISGGVGSGLTRVIPPAQKHKGSANVVTVTLKFAPQQTRTSFMQTMIINSTDPTQTAASVVLSGSTR